MWASIDERVGLSGLTYPVPAHAHRLGYVLGGVTIVGFLILVLSGLWLAQFYNPSPDAAYDSVDHIMKRSPWGRVARGVHFWTANVVLVTVLLHMSRIFINGAYKRPREVNWLVGLVMGTLALAMVFTGTVLKWDQQGFEALTHGIELGSLLGPLGALFSPEFEATLPLLGRVYVAHIAALPALLGLLLIPHLLLVKRQGISMLVNDADRAVDGLSPAFKKGSRFAAHIGRIAILGLLLLASVVVLSLVAAAPLGPRPVSGVATAKPPWIFLPLYEVKRWFGASGVLAPAGVLFGALAIVPFVDRSRYRSPRRRRVILFAAILVAVGLAMGAVAAQFGTGNHA